MGKQLVLKDGAGRTVTDKLALLSGAGRRIYKEHALVGGAGRNIFSHTVSAFVTGKATTNGPNTTSGLLGAVFSQPLDATHYTRLTISGYMRLRGSWDSQYWPNGSVNIYIGGVRIPRVHSDGRYTYTGTNSGLWKASDDAGSNARDVRFTLVPLSGDDGGSPPRFHGDISGYTGLVTMKIEIGQQNVSESGYVEWLCEGVSITLS